MTDREIMQQALDALELIDEAMPFPVAKLTIKNLRERLAQPEQEPVGDEWTPCMKLPVVVHVRKQRFGEAHVSTREGIAPVKFDDLIMRGVSGEEYPIGRAIFEQTYSLNTAPLQRQWVGLTDEEEERLIHNFGNDPHTLLDEVNARLQKRNT